MHANGADGLTLEAMGSGTSQTVSYTVESTVDDYMIVIVTLTQAGVLTLSINGRLVDVATGVGIVSGAAATAYIGRDSAAAEYNLNKPLLGALIDGVLPQKQVLPYERQLRNTFNLPITT